MKFIIKFIINVRENNTILLYFEITLVFSFQQDHFNANSTLPWQMVDLNVMQLSLANRGARYYHAFLDS